MPHVKPEADDKTAAQGFRLLASRPKLDRPVRTRAERGLIPKTPDELDIFGDKARARARAKEKKNGR